MATDGNRHHGEKKARRLYTREDVALFCQAALTASKNGAQFADYVRLLAPGRGPASHATTWIRCLITRTSSPTDRARCAAQKNAAAGPPVECAPARPPPTRFWPENLPRWSAQRRNRAALGRSGKKNQKKPCSAPKKA